MTSNVFSLRQNRLTATSTLTPFSSYIFLLSFFLSSFRVLAFYAKMPKHTYIHTFVLSVHPLCVCTRALCTIYCIYTLSLNECMVFSIIGEKVKKIVTIISKLKITRLKNEIIFLEKMYKTTETRSNNNNEFNNEKCF